MNIKIEVEGLKCERCGHEWVPRIPNPRLCAKCKSAYFDVPKGKNNDRTGHRVTGREADSVHKEGR